MKPIKQPKVERVYEPVPCLWPGETLVILASGPSLTLGDVDACRGRARVLAIKDTIHLAPWADVLYACGSDRGQWWNRFGDSLKDFAGLRYTLDPAAERWATVLRNAGASGLEPDPDGLRHGHNSGYQAIGLAVKLGAAKIVLLGYDMQPDAKGKQHYYGIHAWQSAPPFATFLEYFASLIQPLAALGVTVVNATRRTALACFPCVSLEEALA